MTRKPTKELSNILTDTALLAACPDLPDWSTIWHIEERDLVPGKDIVAVFTPFLLHLLHQGLTRKTFNLHRDNLWTLGGKLVSDLYDTPKLRRRPAIEWIMSAVDGGQGPLMHGGRISEQEQRRFDSTCKKLYRFLTISQHQP